MQRSRTSQDPVKRVVLIDDHLHEKVDCEKAKQLADQIKAEARKS